MENTEQLEKLKIRIPYNEVDYSSKEEYEKILTTLLEDSKNIALSNLYPFMDWSENNLPKKLYNWQIRAAVEIYNYYGKEGVKSYSENGLSFSRDTDGLSNELKEEIMPMAGFIKPKTEANQ